MKLFTIGFTKKSAQRFFELLRSSGARRVVDMRLNNVSQLAGFAKRDNLAYFANEICGMDYIHLPVLAPTQEMLDQYRKRRGDWSAYERQFIDLMKQRRVEDTVPRERWPRVACSVARTSRTIATGGWWPSTSRSTGRTSSMSFTWGRQGDA